MFKILLAILLLQSGNAFATAANFYSKDIGDYEPFDSIGAANYPKCKMIFGADGTATSVTSGAGLPVSATFASKPVVQFLDTNAVLDTSSTNIAGSGGAILVVVASLNQATTAMTVGSTIGAFIGVYSGSTLKFVIAPGDLGTYDVTLANAAAIGVRNMGTATLSAGSLAIQFR